MAVAEEGRGQAKVFTTIPNEIRTLVKLLRKLSRQGEVRCCYEAGFSGFDLARKLKREGFECVVVAPSLVPQQAGQRVKTDRLDAERLAHYLRSGDLTEVSIPDEATEAMRDLTRAREDAKAAERAACHQLAKFLLRQGRRYEGTTHWTLST